MGSVVSAIQVQEALKLLHEEYGLALIGKRLVINCRTNDYYSVSLRRKTDCTGHLSLGEVTRVPEWSAASTTPKDLLSRFECETGEAACVDLGRELVTQLTCPECARVDLLPELKRHVTVSEAACPRCGTTRVPDTTHTAQTGDRWSEWPLDKVGIPMLDILQVMGPTASARYELSGDMVSLSRVLERVDSRVR
jgi:hypothetical protein